MYLTNYFLRTKSLVVFFLAAALVGCQGGINNGASSHVSTGTKSYPLAQSQPAEQPKPVQPKPVQPKPVSKPAPKPTPKPIPPQSQPASSQPYAAQSAPTNVQVLPANPQQGVPLGDDTQVAMDSIKSQPKPAAPAYTPPATYTPPTTYTPPPAYVPPPSPQPYYEPEAYSAPASKPRPAPAPVAVVVEPSRQASNDPETTWLQRYPNLSEDLKNYEETINHLEEEAKAYRARIDDLQQKVKQQWGGVAPTEPTARKFVKYTDSYKSRGEMDFENGKIIVETVDTSNPKQRLKEAIMTTLLTPFDAESPEIYTDKKINYIGPSLLAGQVLDHEGQPVKWEWRAERFADYLVDNKVQQVKRNGQMVHRVEIPLIENHNQVRGHQYEHLVRTASQRYGIDEVLIYAIMETESNFNPYATSHIPAYGLMQVVPSTAGKDVFKLIKKRNDQPTRDYLFNTTNNIDAGTAYLSILRDNYLNKITHPLSREYAMISGYNGGAGNVLRTFHQDRALAVNAINQLTPKQVYDRLHLKHPRSEARGYIKKVTEAQQRYRVQASASR